MTNIYERAVAELGTRMGCWERVAERCNDAGCGGIYGDYTHAVVESEDGAFYIEEETI